MSTVLCMKWGKPYGPEYVNRLRSMVRRNLTLPHRFVCLTDDRSGIDPDIECRPLPVIDLPGVPSFSGWRKLSSFSPELNDLAGPILFLDLDLVITSNIDGFFTYPGEFCIIKNWTQMNQGIGNSSVYRYELPKHNFVFKDWQQRAREIPTQHRNEQIYLSRIAKPLTWWPESWCRSFKRHCLPGGPLNWFVSPRRPEDARIIVFHGDPKPPDAARGVWPKRFKRIRPAPWIDEFWS
jgi:hypothetical protein